MYRTMLWCIPVSLEAGHELHKSSLTLVISVRYGIYFVLRIPISVPT